LVLILQIIVEILKISKFDFGVKVECEPKLTQI